MTYATEKQSRRKFIGLLGVGAGMAGFLAGASALGAANGNHNILSAAHPDTLPAIPQDGDLLQYIGGTGGWQRLPLGVGGTFLKSTGAIAGWGEMLAKTTLMETAAVNPATISAVADDQAPLTLSVTRATVIYEAWVQLKSAVNAPISWTFAVHDANHANLSGLTTRTIVIPAFGVGTVFEFPVYIFEMDLTPILGSYHLNTTALALNGGTIRVFSRVLWGTIV